ncbi:MAG: glutathione S-transferase family protein, partial [Nevskiales bacterium]
MQNNRLVFYDSPLSPCARRVRVTLAAKQISHAVEYVDISKAEQKRPAYKAINPYGKVPAMTVDGRPLWESNIMTQYLDEAFACPALYPSDPLDYARVREWQAFEIRFAQTFFMLMYHRLAGTVLRVQKRSLERFVADIKKQSNDPAFIEFNKKAFLGSLLNSTEEAHHEQLLLDGIGKIEDALQDGRAYLIGAHFSQADISVFPRMRMLVYLGVVVDKTRYPNTSRWLTRVDRQPSMSASMTANEQMMANPLMLRMLRWARYPSLKPADEQSLAERVGLRLMHHLLALDALAIERLVVGLKKRLPKSRVDQSGISAPQRPVNMSSPTLTLAYNPASGEGQAASEILRWLGIDAA